MNLRLFPVNPVLLRGLVDTEIYKIHWHCMVRGDERHLFCVADQLCLMSVWQICCRAATQKHVQGVDLIWMNNRRHIRHDRHATNEKHNLGANP